MILMNKYRSSLEKIKVTSQMEERILRNVSSKKEQGEVIKKQPYLKWIKPVGTIAACFAIVIGIMSVYPTFMNNNGRNQQITHPNPISNAKGVNELKKAVPFELFVPEKLPTEYKIDKTSVISGKLAQIIYSDGSNKITYRAAKGAEDISGDYISYEESDVVKIGDAEVTLKGSNTLINLATWIKDDCSYSLSFSTGIEKETVISIIESMKKA
jgi:hypothetical protein